jgi:hypothetical protein
MSRRCSVIWPSIRALSTRVMGLENAKRRGVQLGRPAIKKLDAAEIVKVRAERSKGATMRQLAKTHGTSLWSIHKLCSN